MQIVYHLGAHGSDQDRLIRTLLRNREALWQKGIEIPPPRRYRGVLGGAINSLNGGLAPAELQQTLLDALIDGERADRIILSQSSFLGVPQRAVSAEGLYPRGPFRLQGLSNLFPEDVVEFFLSVVHPATQVAALVAMSNGDYASVMGQTDPRELRWAPAIRAMQQAVPDRELVVWAQEDLPFVWPEILRRMADVGPETLLLGDDAILFDLLPAEAMSELQTRIDALPRSEISARRDLIEQALTEHAAPKAMEAAVTLPGWSQDLIDDLDEIYAADLAEIAAITGVEFMSP
ncbi:hypothetical protein [Paracoccus jeotgali]|uniref:hypothetical protein n=1 Tax=Paracoccus jeotgali TaxID=2065379 RepID=UPI0028AEEB0B|nr:hypothetical protein [Paracoccus jeotgali]